MRIGVTTQGMMLYGHRECSIAASGGSLEHEMDVERPFHYEPCKIEDNPPKWTLKMVGK